MHTTLIVPGYTNSGPGHWQTLWQASNPSYRRVEQDSRDFPDRAAWVARLAAAIEEQDGPLVLIAHSLGCAAVAHWATQHANPRVVAAMLVAPADVDRPDFPAAATGFSPMPLNALPFQSLVVTSSDDEYVSVTRAREFADKWGSTFANVGPCGHINTAAGFGPWSAGERLLNGLIADALP